MFQYMYIHAILRIKKRVSRPYHLYPHKMIARCIFKCKYTSLVSTFICIECPWYLIVICPNRFISTGVIPSPIISQSKFVHIMVCFLLRDNYLHQCSHIINWIFKKTISIKFELKRTFFGKNELGNVVCKCRLFGPRCVKAFLLAV